MLGSLAIPAAECEGLLAASGVGRVALCTSTGPYIVPVDYGVVDHDILFRTSTLSVLGTFGRNARLAFEVDEFDDESYGWCVQATGRGEPVVHPETLARLGAVWPPRSRAAGARYLVLRLSSAVLTGSRIEPSVHGSIPSAQIPR